MISDNTAFDQFISDHRWAVLTTMRGVEPVSSVVAYARDGDELVVSTPGTTFKTRSVAANSNVTICVLTNREPFNFVSIEGSAYVQHDNLEQDTTRVFENLAGTGYKLPADLSHWLDSQQRVILRIKPKRVHGVIR